MRANIECWLGSLVLFQGIRTSIAMKPYRFVIFQGVWGPDSLPPSGSAHVRSLITSCILNDSPILFTVYFTLYGLHIFAHLAASSNNFNGNDQNRILGK